MNLSRLDCQFFLFNIFWSYEFLHTVWLENNICPLSWRAYHDRYTGVSFMLSWSSPCTGFLQIYIEIFHIRIGKHCPYVNVTVPSRNGATICVLLFKASFRAQRFNFLVDMITLINLEFQNTDFEEQRRLVLVRQRVYLKLRVCLYS